MKRTSAAAGLAVLMILTGGGCTSRETASSTPAASTPAATVTAQPAPTAPAAKPWFQEFKAHTPGTWEKSTGYTNGDPFDCFWSGENISFNGKEMELKLSKDPTGKKLGAEYKTSATYHYGRYEVRMKAAKNSGIVSSFFTYTGPSFGTPWDEIDFEVLGKDTTKVQLNYYTNGTGGHEVMIDLGFDASEEYHNYAFEWRKESIKWYVDDKLVHTATANLPVTPGKIMMNLWNGKGVDSWLGAYDGTVPLTAKYEWMKFTPYEESAAK